jgi:hypothetical protein
MLTATTEVEAPLSVAKYSYITPRGVFQGGGGFRESGARSSLNSSLITIAPWMHQVTACRPRQEQCSPKRWERHRGVDAPRCTDPCGDR